MTTEQLDWLEKVNIIVKKWTIGKTITEIRLSDFGSCLTLFLRHFNSENEHTIEIVIRNEWNVQPAGKEFSVKCLQSRLARKIEECQYKTEHFTPLCDMIDQLEITEALIVDGGQLLLTFGNEQRLCIEGKSRAEYSDDYDCWVIVAGLYNLKACEGKVGGVWNPFELRDEIKNNKAEP